MTNLLVKLESKYSVKAAGSLGEVLRRSRAKMKPALTKHLPLLYEYFNLINIAGMASADGSKLSDSKYVAANLLGRIANDLLGMATLATDGLSSQCAVIAASTYECAVTIGAIGNDDSEAAKWLNHADVRNSIESVKELSKRTQQELQIKFELYDFYSQLCGPKHSNPVSQKHAGRGACNQHLFCSAQYFFPAGSPRDQFLAGVAIEIALMMTGFALRSYIDNHVKTADNEDFSNSLISLDKKLARLLELRASEEPLF